MLIGITKKNTRKRSRCEFIWGSGIGIGKTETTKNTKFRIIRIREKKGEIGSRVGIGFRRPDV